MTGEVIRNWNRKTRSKNYTSELYITKLFTRP